jgi:hypothetical protein
VRRLIRYGLAATAAALVAGGMIALAGAVPASAAAATAAPSVKIAAVSARASTAKYEVSASCTFTVGAEKYFSSYGYWTIKAWYTTGTCGTKLEAGITCSSHNLWGKEDTSEGEGAASVAACNKSYPKFDHGGYRIYVNGSWVYYTDKF